jgi:hypothetical protein
MLLAVLGMLVQRHVLSTCCAPSAGVGRQQQQQASRRSQDAGTRMQAEGCSCAACCNGVMAGACGGCAWQGVTHSLGVSVRVWADQEVLACPGFRQVAATLLTAHNCRPAAIGSDARVGSTKVLLSTDSAYAVMVHAVGLRSIGRAAGRRACTAACAAGCWVACTVLVPQSIWAPSPVVLQGVHLAVGMIMMLLTAVPLLTVNICVSWCG